MPVCKDGSHLQPALSKHLPVVLFDRTIDSLIDRVDSVVADNVQAAEDATCCLIENGHTKIGIILGPRDVFTSRQRLIGYKKAYEKNGLAYDSSYIAFSDYTVHGGHESMNRLLAGPRDMSAVFVTNYEMTLGAIIAINEAGIKLPGELSIIGFDNLQLSQVIKPRLTIITQPLEEIGMQVAAIILERLSGTVHSMELSGISPAPSIVTLATHLQPGESVMNRS